MTTDEQVEQWLRDIQFTSPAQCPLVQDLRTLVRQLAPDARERVMYGGLLYELGTAFCGIFPYKGHVSVEFSRGCDLEDAHGQLEGSGKWRRHVKLHSTDDIVTKHLETYLLQAYKVASAGVFVPGIKPQ
ncbi:MAG: DUF1801 domain-containing protein [Marinobacter sp.]|nr:DUF1801 domain-containing protein [Marinobacter sp.]